MLSIKKLIAILLSLTLIVCFCSCSGNNETKDIHIENAEKVMENYFAAREYDLSELVYEGFVEISDETYIKYTMKNTPKKYYYVAIDEEYNVYTSFDKSEIRLVWYNITATTTTFTSYNDIHISNANKVMKNYLIEYDKSLSDVQCKGIVELSDQEYVEYELKDSPDYSCYVAINENYNVYGGYDNSELEFLWENTST